MGEVVTVDEETADLVRKLALATGKQLPEVVKEAVVLAALQAGVLSNPRDQADMLARMRAQAQRFDRLPILDDRSADEILGYGDHGSFQ